MREYAEPQLCYLFLICSTLSGSVVLCFYGLKGISKHKRKKAKYGSQRKTKGACVRRLTSLQWLAQAIVVCNVLRQLFYFEYYVVQRITFRGFDKSSPMHAICRVSKFVYHTSELWVFCALFWFQRLLVTFDNPAISAHSVSATTVYRFYGSLTILIVLMEAMCVYTVVNSTDIIALKSSDVNLYQSVNPNMALCNVAAGKQIYLVAGFAPIIGLFLAINAFLAYMYVRKLKSVFALAKRQSSAKERRLVRKTVTVALVTTASTFLTISSASVLSFHVLWALDAFINSLCVVLYFEFASDKYQLLCGRIEGCIMWSLTARIPVMKDRDKVMSITDAIEGGKIQSTHLRTSSVTEMSEM